MDTEHQEVARQCLEGAESGKMTFPQIVGTLTAAGFDGYLVDLRLGQATYYLPDGMGGWRQLFLPLATFILAGLEPSSLVHHRAV
jgi:hypothetical protein